MNEIKIRSLINSTFSKECMYDLYMLTLCPLSTNDRVAEIENVLSRYKINHAKLGAGTNRYAVLIDGYAVKIALDVDGMTDNKREMMYSNALQPHVVKVYECMENGLIAVLEYVKPFDQDDFYRMKSKMRSILQDITEGFLIGDIGITLKNYINWGMRSESEICILDFAYIYSVKYKVFTCPKCKTDSSLVYDENYVNLTCPICGSSFTFSEIRKRISKEDEQTEIGDMKQYGYIVPHNMIEMKVQPNEQYSSYLFVNEDKEETVKERSRRMFKKAREEKWLDECMDKLKKGKSLDKEFS